LAAIGWVGLVTPGFAQGDTPAVARVDYQAPSSGARFTAFVSDLHLGVGHRSDGSWDPTEDFRWPKALQGFVDKISEMGNNRTDLVIVGDFLELWQPPPTIRCTGIGADLGCTIEEMTALSRLVADQHKAELETLKNFAERGENRLHIIVGNHDSTLRYEKVWSPIGTALNVANGRTELVVSGLWTSADGRIVAEHGHQIGEDVNRYDTWPDITRRANNQDFVIRPWGELFVQRLFNSQEASYPVIDNLSPETAGARIRAADRGFWGSAYDIGRLIVFSLLETSINQDAHGLGGPQGDTIVWNVEDARKKGASLLLSALEADDPMRLELQKGGPQAEAIEAEMAKLVQALPIEEIRQICDLVALRTPSNRCSKPSLGEVKQNLLESKEQVMAKHLASRKNDNTSMRVFIYGHTHQYEQPWGVKLEGSAVVTVANTGAFQRLIDEKAFKARLNGRSEVEALRKMDLAELAPCYTSILISDSSNSKLMPEVKSWYMPEDGPGTFLSPDNSKCTE
jgi:UDP-2,3-diacylglucosamine pyrophosphatase LpxH